MARRRCPHDVAEAVPAWPQEVGAHYGTSCLTPKRGRMQAHMKSTNVGNRLWRNAPCGKQGEGAGGQKALPSCRVGLAGHRGDEAFLPVRKAHCAKPRELTRPGSGAVCRDQQASANCARVVTTGLPCVLRRDVQTRTAATLWTDGLVVCRRCLVWRQLNACTSGVARFDTRWRTICILASTRSEDGNNHKLLRRSHFPLSCWGTKLRSQRLLQRAGTHPVSQRFPRQRPFVSSRRRLPPSADVPRPVAPKPATRS